MVQDNIQHFRREAAFGCESVIAQTRMHTDYPYFLVGELSGLVQYSHRDERLADIVQKGGADQTALIVLAHTEMLRERNSETGDKEAVAIAVSMMAADGRQPFTQRGLLDGFENLVFSFQDVAECQRSSRRELLEYLDHHRMRGRNAPVQSLAVGGCVESIAVRKCGADTLQNTLRIKRPRYRIRGAQRPGLHRPMVKGVRENEQPRH